MAMCLLSLLLTQLFVLSSSHTMKICVSKGTEGDIIFWGGVWHAGNIPIVGAVLLSGGPLNDTVNRYDFTSKVSDDGNENPSGVDLENFVCTRCDTTATTYNWQKAVIDGSSLEPGTYDVTTTAEDPNGVEWPGCEFPNITIPAFGVCQKPCENSPCDCDEVDENNNPIGDFDPKCDICHPNGCDRCDEDNGWFKPSFNHPCVQCQEVFGNECLHCQDFNGCAQCDDGFRRVEEDCGDHILYKCEEIPPTPEPTPHGNDCPNYDTTIVNDCNVPNYHCDICQTWGCEKCIDGYYKMNNNQRCQSCTYHYPNCKRCADWQGCVECDAGYTLQWNPNCQDEVCQ